MAYNLLLAKRIKMTSYKWWQKEAKAILYVKKFDFKEEHRYEKFPRQFFFSIALFKPYQTIINSASIYISPLYKEKFCFKP